MRYKGFWSININSKFTWFNGIRNAFNKFDNRFPEFANRKSNSETILLPEEYVGNMMVFRTFDKISYALVMEINGPVHVLDTVRSL